MVNAAPSPILQLIRRTVEDRRVRDRPDQELLQRFHGQQDQTAFQALLRRHGSMVLEVCRSLLGNEPDTEDAFQATFLILVRKAGSIRKTASLGSWLYGVAYRTALKARAQSAARRQREARAPARQAAEADDLSWREMRQVLHAEVSGLAERYRAPLVLCYLEGATQEAAALQLNLAKSTLRERLERGRALLRRRLLRRGLGPAALLVAAAWPAANLSASVPIRLGASTIKAASLVAAGQTAARGVISARVAALTEGVMNAMCMTKLKIATALVLVVGIVAGVGLFAPLPMFVHQSSAAQPPAQKEADKPQAPAGAGDMPVWREMVTLKHEHAITAIACSSDWSVAGDERGHLFAWDTKTGKDLTPLERDRKTVELGWKTVDRLQFTADEKDQYTPDGKSLRVIWGGRQGWARYFVKDKKFEGGRGFGGGPVDGVKMGYVGVSADAEIQLEVFREGKAVYVRRNIYVWQMGRFVRRPNFDLKYRHESVEYNAIVSHALVSAGEKWLAVATKDGILRIHDPASLQETHALAVGKEGVDITDMQFSADGKRIAIARSDGLAKVYDTAEGEEVTTLKGHSGIVFTIAFSPDGKTIVTGGDDNIARVWDAATGEALDTLKGHTDSVRCAAFDPSGEILVTGSADKTVKVWRAR